MEEFLIKLSEHLFFVILCFVFLWGIKKVFLFLLMKITQNQIIDGKNCKCDVEITNIKDMLNNLIPSTHTKGKITLNNKKKNRFNIRIINPDKEYREQIDTSIMLYVKPEEIPFYFSFKLFFIIFRYSILLNIFKSGNIKLKATKRMLSVLDDKMDDISVLKFNNNNIEKFSKL